MSKETGQASPEAAAPLDLELPGNLINRELSLLEFNARVLEQDIRLLRKPFRTSELLESLRAAIAG